MLRSDLCDYSNAYNVFKGDIALTKASNQVFIDVRNRFLAFENNAPFTDCILKVNGVLIDNQENLNFVMPMYNLIEYRKNYRKTTESLWNYYRDEPNDFPANNNSNPIINSESFKYNTNITGKTLNTNQENGETIEPENIKTKKILEIIVSLKHLSNFWRMLDMPLINSEINLILKWSENCVLTDKITQAGNPNADPAIPPINAPTNATFKIRDAKLYIVCSSCYSFNTGWW